MKFGLEIQVSVDDKLVPLTQLTSQTDLTRKLIADPATLEGCLMPFGNGKPVMPPYSDPLLLLLEQWCLKVPWILGGDTEVVPLRNHLFSFAFEPITDVVDVTVFTGTKNEIEEYILEPFQVPLDQFCDITIQNAKALVKWMENAEPDIAERSADLSTMKEALAEADRAFKDFRVRQSR